MATTEETCPSYIGSRLILLTPSDPSAQLAVGVPYSVKVDTSPADSVGGPRPPYMVTIGCPSAADSRMIPVRLVAPVSVTVTPKEKGRHIVSVKELFGARLWGSITLDVE